jgi:hypothetical protein
MEIKEMSKTEFNKPEIMKYSKILSASFLILVIFFACSDLKDNIETTAPSITTHGSGAFDPASSEYHGNLVLNSTNGMTDCQKCHAADYSGGITGVSCQACHSTINIHKDGIVNRASNNFHPKYLKANNQQMNVCSSCHGIDYSGGIASPTCVNCHGGISVHKEGITDTESPNFHGKFIASIHWDLTKCSQCHTENYSGGLISTSCLGCHTQTNGPEACNTCHGDFNDPSKISPPRALNGSTETTFAGVGAHNKHLNDNTLGSDISCSTCHKVPQSFSSTGHIDSDGKAELTFGELAKHGGANPSYNFTDNKCSNAYCHGNFVFRKSQSNFQFIYTDSIMVGNKFSPTWNIVDGTEAACGSCHGLPPTGHADYDLTACVNCHSGVVDAQGNIVDKTKHINGIVNAFGN